MKTKLLPVACCILLSCYAINSNAQANQKLSNLTAPTAVNQSLLPGTNNTINLGSNSLRWKNLYLGNALYLKGNITLHTPGIENFFVGLNAGNTSLTGEQNTGAGQFSLSSLTSGQQNTANGYSSLYSNTTGGANTANGHKSLSSNTTGSYNTASGAGSLFFNTTGSNNTASGSSSLLSNTTGSHNTANGAYSLQANTTGYANTASGSAALHFNTTGYQNTAYGWEAMIHNTEGFNNTASGVFSLSSNTTGFFNTASGSNSLYLNTTGSYNTTSGYESLFDNETGTYNTASGVFSLYHNTSGYSNTAAGASSLYFNTTGYSNTAYGLGSLLHNTTGHYNTACGFYSLYNNTTGSYNTASGYSSLYSNTTGSENTALGFNANVVFDTLFNATAIGYGALVNKSNKVRIGNTIVTSIEGQVTLTTPSDGRYKKDIKENVQGLAFINSLRPITYTVNVKGLNEYYNKGRKQLSNNSISDNEDGALNAEMKKAEDEASKIVYNGFIAQEVEAAAKKLNYDFSGVDKPQTKDGLHGLRYADFVVPLVKAVQELSKMNDAKDAAVQQQSIEIADLKSRLAKLEAMINVRQSTGSNQQAISLSTASLEQNIPNPFNHTTIINYTLPSKFTTAQIIITDKNGKQLKQLNISGSGNGTVNIDASTLSSGTYNYSLIIDGKVINTKQMLLGK